MTFQDKHFLITGGSDGIGAATALELQQRGALVTITGRSLPKLQAVAARTLPEGHPIHAIQADFSNLREVQGLPAQFGDRRFDYLLHCVGTLNPRAEYTAEGLEKNFVTSYLSRFYLTQQLLDAGRIAPAARIINVAASSPRIPAFAKLDFQDPDTVNARSGMQGHGQAQLANDIFVAELSRRTALTVIGYGPGSVRTNIRRELPGLMTLLMKPFFAWTTREPEAAAQDIIGIFRDPGLEPGSAYYFKQGRRFEPDPFIIDLERGQRLWTVSQRLTARAGLAQATG